jgi:phospholipid transport system substrate-binding protein
MAMGDQLLDLRRRFAGRVIALIFLLWSGPLAAAPTVEDAGQFMMQLADEAIATLRAADLTQEQREVIFYKLMDTALDFDAIGRFAAGRHYQTMTPPQRAEYHRLFMNFVIKTYARRLSGYSGESFTVTSARAMDEQHVLVRSRIVRPNAPPVELDWRLRASATSYRIVDLTIEGVSMAVTQRQDFSAVIGRAGIDGLLAALRMRADLKPTAAAN